MIQSHKLSNKFKEFLEKGLFIDCILKCGNKSIKCHGIVLSRFSGYFKEKLVSDCTTEKVKSFEISDKLQENIDNIINFFYGDYLEITEDNIIPVLAFSIKYDIPVLKEAARDQLIEAYAKKETVLNLSQQMVKYGIADYSENLIPIFVENFDSFQLGEIIRSVSAKELGMIIGDKNFKTNKVPEENLTEFKLSILDKFYELTPFQDESVKEFLEGLFDWHQDDSYLFVVKHKCKWARDETVLPLYKEAMKHRREAYKKFKEDAEGITSSKVSRWLPLQWCSQTLNAVSSFDDFDAVEFCMSLGNIIKDVNPLALGVLNSTCSTPLGLKDNDTVIKMYNTEYGPQGAFMHNDQYFISLNAGANISVSFGERAKLRISKIIVESVPEKPGEVKLNKKPTKDFKLNKEMKLGFPTSLKLAADKMILCDEVEFTDHAEYSPRPDFIANEIKISMASKNKAGGNILRVGRVKIFGRFIKE